MNTIDRAFVRLNVISNHLNMEGTSNKCQNPLKVCVTGAAGQIAYSLLPMIACGQMFGPSQPVILHLLDIPQCEKAMQGVVMELDDGAFPLLRGVVATSDVNVAFKGVDVAVLVGAFPRMKGMERKDLLAKNITIFREQGRAINAHASRNVKVLVVGNPANTNCLIAKHFAPDIPATNFSALTRLDHNRAKAQVAQRLSVPISSVHNVFIWGNHSSTQYPDVNHGSVNLSNGQTRSVRSAINDDNYLNTSFIHTVQTRGAAIIEARKLSSAASAARAVCDHIRDWVNGTPKDEAVSMAVPSDGSYGIPEGVIYSYPVTCQGGKYTIVQGLNIDKFSREKMDLTYAELLEEKQAAFQLLN